MCGIGLVVEDVMRVSPDPDAPKIGKEFQEKYEILGSWVPG